MVAALVRGGGGKETQEVHRGRVAVAEERRETMATSSDSILPTGQRVEVGIGSSRIKNWAG